MSPKNIQDNSRVYLINNTFQSSSLNDQSFADLISHMLGGPVINSEVARDSFPKSSLFDKASGNLLFVIDTLDSVDLAQFNDLKMLKQNGKMVELVKTSYPQDTIASLATLSSGVSPSVHGITGSSWAIYTGQIQAYKSGALPFAQNLADSFSQTFDGRSLIVSSSSDFQMASAFGVNQFVHQTSNNEITMFWNPLKRAFDTIYSSNLNVSSLSTSAPQNRETIAKNFLAMPGSEDTITFDRDEMYTVNMVSKGINVMFTSNDLVKLTAELLHVRNLLESLQNDASFKSMTSDNVPDLFTFSFASIKNIAVKYGIDSDHYRAVIYLIDEAIVSAMKTFSSLYHNKMSAQIIFMGLTADQTLAANNKDRTQIQLATTRFVRKDVFDNNFPSLYLVDHALQEHVCAAMKVFLQFDVYCAEDLEFPSHVSFPPLQNQTTNSTVYGKDAAIYQICIWFPIILILSMLAVICAFCTMDVGGDSMIYRSTNLRHQHNL